MLTVYEIWAKNDFRFTVILKEPFARNIDSFTILRRLAFQITRVTIETLTLMAGVTRFCRQNRENSMVL